MATDPVLDIFSEAVDLPEAERLGYLDRACAGDADLRRKVESLLAHDGELDDRFLTPPLPDPRFDLLLRQGDDAADLVGRTMGAYTIRSRIASGGMGTVYLAEQASPRREVALKILHGGFGGGTLRKRFEREAHILGLLRHPNIAQIYEAGTGAIDEGNGVSRRVSYFAMEYVPGAATITQYAKSLTLDLRRRLELFVDVCDAVHHGHQRGIVHRDLKPANILVDETGRPKVIDFGVARVTDSDVAVTTMQTDAGQLIGTLAYMSPEQCAADPREIHTPSDIYSLGVVLYELLTDRMPYDVSNLTIHAATRVICEQEPTAPSRFDRRLRGDLETIILKAIEKDRAKRYSSAAALADELRRTLGGEPIMARPSTGWSKTVRWASRHPVAVTAIACLLVACSMLAATALTTWFLTIRPDRLELTDRGAIYDPTFIQQPVRNGDRARLMSSGGQVLQDWRLKRGRIFLAAMTDRPASWGGGKVVVLGFSNDAEGPNVYPGSLCIFEADRASGAPTILLRVEQDEIDRMPNDAWPRSKWNPNRRYNTEGFSVYNSWIMDVFSGKEHPGDEIIVYFMHSPGSQGVLRIYNLNGELLFQAWQDGGIHDAFLEHKSQQLIFLATKGDKDKSESGLSIGANHPAVVFAIKPEPKKITNAWISPHRPDWGPADWYPPIWYRMPCPAQFADAHVFKWALLPPFASEMAGNKTAVVRLQFVVPRLKIAPDVNLEFCVGLGQNGEIVTEPIYGDLFRPALNLIDDFPDPWALRLMNWTEAIPPCLQTTSMPAKP